MVDDAVFQDECTHAFPFLQIGADVGAGHRRQISGADIRLAGAGDCHARIVACGSCRCLIAHSSPVNDALKSKLKSLSFEEAQGNDQPIRSL